MVIHNYLMTILSLILNSKQVRSAENHKNLKQGKVLQMVIHSYLMMIESLLHCSSLEHFVVIHKNLVRRMGLLMEIQSYSKTIAMLLQHLKQGNFVENRKSWEQHLQQMVVQMAIRTSPKRRQQNQE